MPSRSPGGPGTVEVVPGVVALTGLEGLPPVEAEAIARVTAILEDAFVAGHHRVEAEVEPDDWQLRRVLQRSGLRPEGVSRGRGPRGPHEAGSTAYPDLLRLARLVDDPEPGTPAAFLGMLDATLPLKRVIVQGLVHDGAGRLLLCELTYKKEWDLVGGVAEPAESPVESLEREVREELGVELPVGDLIGVDWLPPYRQWRDALLLVFDLGVHPDLAEHAVLQRSELAGLRWCTVEEAEGRVAPYVHRLLASLRGIHERTPGHVVFLEDGLPRAGR